MGGLRDALRALAPPRAPAVSAASRPDEPWLSDDAVLCAPRAGRRSWRAMARECARARERALEWSAVVASDARSVRPPEVLSKADRRLPRAAGHYAALLERPTHRLLLVSDLGSDAATSAMRRCEASRRRSSASTRGGIVAAVLALHAARGVAARAVVRGACAHGWHRARPALTRSRQALCRPWATAAACWCRPAAPPAAATISRRASPCRTLLYKRCSLSCRRRTRPTRPFASRRAWTRWRPSPPPPPPSWRAAGRRRGR